MGHLTRGFRTAGQITRPARARPLFLICFVTNDCNYRCEHCFIEGLSTDLDKQLTQPEWLRVSEGAKGAQIILFTGGEPFLRPDLPGIVSGFQRNCDPLHVLIASNGSVPERTAASLPEILAAPGRGMVTIGVSLDGPEAIHDRIRKKKGAHRSAMRTIEVIRGLQERFENLSLNVNTTFCSLNQEALPSFLEAVRTEIRPEGMSLSMIRDKEGEISRINYGRYRDCMALIERHSFFDRRLPHSILGRKISQAKTATILNSAMRGQHSLPCLAGQLVGVIRHQGDVTPCETRPDLLGNLRSVDYQLDALWFSKEKRDFCADVQESKCHCTHECFVSTSLTFNPAAWPRILLDRF